MRETKSWHTKVAQRADVLFEKHGVKLTMGGEPTYIPIHPDGPEWSYSAVGPTKIDYAWKMAHSLVAKHLPGGVSFFCPGKSYPGEVNPRWVIRILSNLDGSRLFSIPADTGKVTPKKFANMRSILCEKLGVLTVWQRFSSERDPTAETWAMAMDHDGLEWKSYAWRKDGEEILPLSEAEGPSGLRLPLNLLPPDVPRRALTTELKAGKLSIFLPPFLQQPFLELLRALEAALSEAGIGEIEMQGYVPPDDERRWLQVGLAADPGVLEINLPACRNWKEYDSWIRRVTTCAEQAGLRSWKEVPGEHTAGTGGGNHLLWGGPTISENPFFARPAWMASILRYWQRHPSLAYLFTGCYVGASSQAPRPDESARDLYDLEMAYAFLETLPPGDHRGVINETLRHLQTDVTGNSHRSEMSFDKFWNVGLPAGALGLIEFRAIESMPRADWMSAVALLWTALAAHTLDKPVRGKLKKFGTSLHDRFFLPSVIWNDLAEIFSDLNGSGFRVDEKLFRDIWNWRFPELMKFRKEGTSLVLRKAHEGWPLLCETPVEGGSTSRFVDTSMQRLEFHANAAFAERYEVFVTGRSVALHPVGEDTFLAGLRYRRTNLYPSLHPGIPVQLPLRVTLVDKKGGPTSEFVLESGALAFHKVKPSADFVAGPACKPGRSGDLTYDLRIP